MIEKINEYRKAIAGFLVPALSFAILALEDGVISGGEWLGILIAALGSSAVVAIVPNAPATPEAPVTPVDRTY